MCEEPLTILLGGQPLVTLMRTPGLDRELAVGYLITEGFIASAADIGLLAHCEDTSQPWGGTLRVELVPGTMLLRSPDTHRQVFSSCSLCGVEVVAQVAEEVRAFPTGQARARDVCELARRLRDHQPLFQATGGTHAAGLADCPLGAAAPVLVCEDIGRHNALDKVVGAAALQRLELQRPLLFLSGRLSFEMVAKAARAGIGAVAGISAPTALSVELAQRLNMFLAGFVRGETFTVYSGTVLT